MPIPPRTQIIFFDGFDDLDAVAPFEILSAAGFPVLAVRPSEQASSVRSAHGLRLEVDGVLDRRAELVIVPGGGWLDTGPGVRAQTEGSLPVDLAKLSAHGTVIASVCTGAMLLSAAGLLKGRRAITNRHALGDLAAAGAIVEPEARVVDVGEVVTAGGPAAGLDLSIHLVERYLGPRAARAAAERLEHEPVGPVLAPAPAPA